MSIAKNYLNELELEDMGRLVNATLDMAERMAKRHIPMTMEDWAKRIDIILEAGDNAVLIDAGKVTAEFAKSFAESEFEKYRIVQDRLFCSDFDRFDDNGIRFYYFSVRGIFPGCQSHIFFLCIGSLYYQFGSCMTMYGKVHFVLHFLKE